MTLVRALPMHLTHVRIFIVAFAMLMAMAIMPAPAHAASLTEAQIAAVVGLLKAFDVDSETVGSVEAILQGSAATEDTPGAESTSSTVVKKSETTVKKEVSKEAKAAVASSTAPVPLPQYRALLRAVGYRGEHATSSEDAWKKESTRDKGLRVLMERLKQHEGDQVGEIYLLFPNLDPAYVTPCGVVKTKRDAFAHQLGFTGMFGALDREGNIVVEGEFTRWLQDPSRHAKWDEVCAAAGSNTATTTNARPPEVYGDPSVNLASVSAAIGSGMAAVIEAYLALFGF